MEEQNQKPGRVNKTSQAQIDRAKQRYYKNKTEILRMATIKNICERGRLPFESTIVQHQLNWEDMAKALEVYIKANPSNENYARVVADERKEVRDFHRFITRNRNQGCRDDDFTVLQKVYLNAHECDKCKEPFQGKRKFLNADDKTGLMRFVLCGTCAVGQAEQATQEIQAEIENPDE
jgi:hypothetical protein